MLSFLRKNNSFNNKQPSQVVDEVAKRISPLLKAEAYKKQGRTWIKQYPDYSAIINIQGDKWNRRGEEVRCAVNYGIFVPLGYETLYQMPVPKTPGISDCVVVKRLNDGKYADHWWVMRNESDIVKSSDQIGAWIKQQALPFFAQIHGIADITTMLEKTQIVLELKTAAILYAELGNKEKARKLFQKTIEKSNNAVFCNNVRAIALRYRIRL